MDEFFVYSLAGLAGWVLGVLFFGGLWWSLKRAVASPHPAAWILISAIVRMSMVLVGLYFVGGGEWQRLLACLIGLMAGRLSILWLTRTTREVEPHAT